jgi:hypothetical protein
VEVAELCAPAQRDRSGLWSRRPPGPAGLEIPQPGVDCRLPKPPVSAEANVRDPAGAGLSPDPLGLHTKPLREFVSCQQPVHRRRLSVGGDADDRVACDDRHDGVVGPRCDGRDETDSVTRLLVVAMTVGSEKWACLEVLDESARIS